MTEEDAASLELTPGAMQAMREGPPEAGTDISSLRGLRWLTVE